MNNQINNPEYGPQIDALKQELLRLKEKYKVPDK